MDNGTLENRLQEVREKLKPIIRERSYKEDKVNMFTLASGKKSPYYFDLKQTLMDPVYLNDAATGIYLLMLKHLESMPKAAGGLTMGADPLVYSISLLSAGAGSIIFPLIVRKQTKDHGSKKRVEGRLNEINETDTVVLIDDVITTGGSTLQAYEALKEIGLNVQYAFCVLDRKEGGMDNLNSQGIDLVPLFTLDDFAS